MVSRQGNLTILHVTSPTSVGGLERVIEGLAVGHRRRGHEVHVATLVFSDGVQPLASALAERGVTVHSIRLTPRAYLRERREMAALCQAARPDVVHTHGYRTDLVDRGVASRMGIPTVTTIHGRDMSGGLKGSFYEWLQRRNSRNFRAVVAVSSALRAEALADGVAPERLHLIPNAWSGLREPMDRNAARRHLDLPEDALVIGWVGRMTRVKGGDLFLMALYQLPEPRPFGVMIGFGEEADALRAKAAALGLDGQLRFYPAISDAGRLFRAFDTYVLSSRSEGLPIVLLEAMAAETPIVATRVGGVPDALSDDDAILVPAENPGMLAAAIRESLVNRTGALERVERAKKKLETDFALGPWLDRYESLYRSLC